MQLEYLQAAITSLLSIACTIGMGWHGGTQDAAEQEQADRLEVIPAQLLNNAAVLHMRGGESHAALALTKEAAQVCSASLASCIFQKLSSACKESDHTLGADSGRSTSIYGSCLQTSGLRTLECLVGAFSRS